MSERNARGIIQRRVGVVGGGATWGRSTITLGLSQTARFVLHDATDLSSLQTSGFDLAVDNKLLHMLVIDEDRERYLLALHKALKPGAWVMFNQLYREGTDDGPITSYEQYIEIYKTDFGAVE